jgi:hypothetical protein
MNRIISTPSLASYALRIAILSYAVLILLMQTFPQFYESVRDKYKQDQLSSQSRNNEHQNLYFTVADTSIAYPYERTECVQLAVFHGFENYKIIRSCIFIIERSLVLTKKLAWFTTTGYRIGLPFLWDPSIPIAHRKLII